MIDNNRSFAPASTLNLFLFALFSLPLILNPVVSLSYDTIYLDPKVYWIYLVILPLSVTVNFYNRKDLSKSGIGFYLIAFFLLWIVATGVFFHRDNTTWFGFSDRKDGIFMHLAYCMAALGGITLFRQEGMHKTIHLIVKYTTIGAIALSSTNIFQQLNLVGVLGAEAYEGVIATPFGGTLGHRGYMGGAVALLLPVLIWSQIHSVSKRAKILNIIAIVLTTWALAGSWSRGPWLAGVLSVIWLLVFNKRLITWRTATALLTGILLFLASSFFLSTNARAFGKNGDAEITGTNGRDKMWSSAVKGILQQPLTGWGSPALWRIMATQNDAYLVPESQDTENWKVYRVPKGPDSAPSFVIENKNGERHGLDFTMNKTHNEFLDYAATYGVPALLLFAAIIGMSIWGSRNVMPGISASIVSYAIYLLTWPEIVRFAPIAWFLIGIALASYQNGSIFKANRGYIQSGIL